MPEITVIGTTSWGITLGTVLARSGLQVCLWARTEQEAIELIKAGPNAQLENGRGALWHGRLIAGRHGVAECADRRGQSDNRRL